MRFNFIPLEERIVLDGAGGSDLVSSYHLENISLDSRQINDSSRDSYKGNGIGDFSLGNHQSKNSKDFIPVNPMIIREALTTEELNQIVTALNQTNTNAPTTTATDAATNNLGDVATLADLIKFLNTNNSLFQGNDAGANMLALAMRNTSGSASPGIQKLMDKDPNFRFPIDPQEVVAFKSTMNNLFTFSNNTVQPTALALTLAARNLDPLPPDYIQNIIDGDHNPPPIGSFSSQSVELTQQAQNGEAGSHFADDTLTKLIKETKDSMKNGEMSAVIHHAVTDQDAHPLSNHHQEIHNILLDMHKNNMNLSKLQDHHFEDGSFGNRESFHDTSSDEENLSLAVSFINTTTRSAFVLNADGSHSVNK